MGKYIASGIIGAVYTIALLLVFIFFLHGPLNVIEWFIVICSIATGLLICANALWRIRKLRKSKTE